MALAAMACHVPERRKQTIRYYGAYANSVRGRERKRQQVEPIPTVLEPVISSEAFRRNWARLIQKVCEVSPLVCPGCQNEMRGVVLCIEEPEDVAGFWSIWVSRDSIAARNQRPILLLLVLAPIHLSSKCHLPKMISASCRLTVGIAEQCPGCISGTSS
jgi:hypothetical protein